MTTSFAASVPSASPDAAGRLRGVIWRYLAGTFFLMFGLVFGGIGLISVLAAAVGVSDDVVASPELLNALLLSGISLAILIAGLVLMAQATSSSRRRPWRLAGQDKTAPLGQPTRPGQTAANNSHTTAPTSSAQSNATSTRNTTSNGIVLNGVLISNGPNLVGPSASSAEAHAQRYAGNAPFRSSGAPGSGAAPTRMPFSAWFGALLFIVGAPLAVLPILLFLLSLVTSEPSDVEGALVILLIGCIICGIGILIMMRAGAKRLRNLQSLWAA
ncbi:hypothetical protein [Lysinibacter cavernae]|uniref:Uncharacterized membrane protein YidH (DUF202 family) n=1 Tax=Lysinibacter cavernae TaxID=1640652 RepID=A0A7X5R079_9MICO|nr:hypothetical protein [Lysinibacter cavernae]NIH53173.1 uncharacterized membrane protein YidH (DUF202 family) [Lysinibacter cavernae]